MAIGFRLQAFTRMRKRTETQNEEINFQIGAEYIKPEQIISANKKKRYNYI